MHVQLILNEPAPAGQRRFVFIRFFSLAPIGGEGELILLRFMERGESRVNMKCIETF
jgi:hypothetical protein